MVDTFFQHSINLLFLGGVILAAFGSGRLILGKMPVDSFSEALVFSVGIGFGLLSCFVFLLCSFGLLYPGAVYTGAGIWGILAWWGLMGPGRRSGPRPTFPRGLSLWEQLTFLILVILLILSTLLVLTPAIGKDALIYHLAVPKAFIDHHGFCTIEGNIFSHYPLNMEMLYVVALIFRGEVLAKGLHFTMGILILFSMWSFSEAHIKKGMPRLLSLLIFFSIPSVFAATHVAYNDLTVAFYSFLAVYGFLNWYARDNARWLAFSGAFCGLALSTKYTALFSIFIGCLGILWAGRSKDMKWQHALGSVSVFCLAAFVVGCPFYIRNWAVTGNPFYPFLYQIFGGKGLDPELARLYDLFVQGLGMGRRVVDYLLLPWNLSVNAKMGSPQFDGIIGPIFIMTLPFAMGIKKTPIGLKVIFFYSFFTFMFWAASAQQIRYLMPILPFLAIAVGYVFHNYSGTRLPRMLLAVSIVIGLGFNGYHLMNGFTKISPTTVVTGTESKHAFLSRTVRGYEMYRYVNRALRDDSRLLFIYMKNFGYLCDRSFYSDSMFESYTIQKILSDALDPGGVLAYLKARRFTHVLCDMRYVYGDLSTLTPKQKSLFKAFERKYLKLVKEENEVYRLYRLYEL
jgi:hypothetical protein